MIASVTTVHNNVLHGDWVKHCGGDRQQLIILVASYYISYLSRIRRFLGGGRQKHCDAFWEGVGQQ